MHVRRLTIAVDIGPVVNPDGVRNQIEGGATQATSWTIKERVRFDRRRITSNDWEFYPILTLHARLPSSTWSSSTVPAPSLGAGEAAQGPTAAAIANAVHAALSACVCVPSRSTPKPSSGRHRGRRSMIQSRRTPWHGGAIS